MRVYSQIPRTTLLDSEVLEISNLLRDERVLQGNLRFFSFQALIGNGNPNYKLIVVPGLARQINAMAEPLAISIEQMRTAMEDAAKHVDPKNAANLGRG